MGRPSPGSRSGTVEPRRPARWTPARLRSAAALSPSPAQPAISAREPPPRRGLSSWRDQRQGEPAARPRTDGRDAPAGLHRRLDPPQSIAQLSGSRIDVGDNRGDAPEAGWGIGLEPRTLDHLDENVADQKEPLANPATGLAHTPALNPDSAERDGRALQRGGEDDHMIESNHSVRMLLVWSSPLGGLGHQPVDRTRDLRPFECPRGDLALLGGRQLEAHGAGHRDALVRDLEAEVAPHSELPSDS